MGEAAAPSGSAKELPREFNPRWKGYLFIIVSSLVNFASISSLETEDMPVFDGKLPVSQAFGVVTFVLSVAILLLDRFQNCCDKDTSDKVNYTKALDGKLEGYTLLAFTLWWIVGVGYITQVSGVAYVATNIYFSAWLTLISCVYTLDKWSAAKDILSIQELTGLSATLKSWYLLFFSSLVVLGTSCDIHISLSEDNKSASIFGVILGLASTLIALFFILVHYRLVDFQFLRVGGLIELSASFFMTLLWVIGTAVLTSEGGIAATLGGSGCSSPYGWESKTSNGEACYVIWAPLDDASQAPSGVNVVPSPTPVPENGSATILPTAWPTKWPVDGEGGTNQTNHTSGAEPQIEGNLTAVPSAENGTSVVPEIPSSNVTTSPNSTGFDFGEALANATTGNSTFMAEDADTDDGFIDQSIIDVDDGEAATKQGNSTTNTTVVRDEQARWLQAMESADMLLNTTANLTDLNYTLPTASPTRRPGTVADIFLTPAPTVANVSYTRKVSCDEIMDQQIPGSNLYLACWICFAASFSITLRWKAAQAIQFAQAQTRKADERAGLTEDDLKEANDDSDEGEDPDDL